jgi:branched-chain amino acid transport system permease protein
MRADRTAVLKWGAVGAVLLVALYLPFGFTDPQLEDFATVMTLALGAMGLSLLTGFSGQISIGHGAFMGIGAYTTAILVADRAAPWFLAIAASAAVCFLAGVLVGLPALRIRGTALALATLGLAVLFPQVIIRYSDVTGGSQGKNLFEYRFRAPEWTSSINLGDPGEPLTDEQWTFYVVLAFLVLATVLFRNLIRSRVGRALIAIRDNEVAAEVLGVNLAAYKVLVFGASAMLAGLGGALAVAINPVVTPGDYNILLSIRLLVMAVVGGIATIAGPIVGAFAVFYANEEFKSQAEELAPVVLGGALILLMMVMPDGIVGGVQRAWRRLRPTPSEPDPTDPAPAGAVTSGTSTAVPPDA